MANKCQSVLDADVLNERGKQRGFSKRERLITPLRFGLSVVASMVTEQVITIADLHRQFNELWELDADDKAFYQQRRTSTSPACFRTSLCHIMGQLTMKVLGCEASQALSACNRLLLQDGSSFALHEALADVFPGRFNAVSPAAVALHCTLEVLSPRSMLEQLLRNHRYWMRRSYSSWGPIHTQINPSPSSMARARWLRPTWADQNLPSFLNCRDGCRGLTLSKA
jgi:hypothetical protein